MKHRHFLAQLDRRLIQAAIRAAELGTSGEIVVMIHRRPVEDAVAAAQAEFLRRGLTRTRHRNGVLIFVSPTAQKFAVIGDVGVHEKCGEGFWRELAGVMAGLFQAGRFTDGLVQGVERAGKLLAEHFPSSPDDRNELPDDVVVR